MKPRFTRLTALAFAGAALLVATVPTAGAAPIDSKRAEATRLQQQIDANGMRISALGERYNGAQIAYDQARAQIAVAQQRLEATRVRTRKIEDVVRRRAAALYRSMGTSTPLRDLDVSSLGERATRSRYTAAAGERDAALIEELARARDQLEIDQRAAQKKLEQAQRERDAARQARAQIESANGEQRRLLAKVRGEIATLMADEQRQRDAAARRNAIARTTRTTSNRTPARTGVDPGTVGGNFPQLPVSGRVAAVIAYARAQIGKPYVFATAGPDTFDCSGLTMMAWRQAGVSMAHFSGAQFNAFPHVSVSQLQPGDLVFKGPGGRDHVALYIGGGMQIAATHTGSYVKLQPLSSPLSGAVRPG